MSVARFACSLNFYFVEVDNIVFDINVNKFVRHFIKKITCICLVLWFLTGDLFCFLRNGLSGTVKLQEIHVLTDQRKTSCLFQPLVLSKVRISAHFLE